jgi:hypothetical protein
MARALGGGRACGKTYENYSESEDDLGAHQ